MIADAVARVMAKLPILRVKLQRICLLPLVRFETCRGNVDRTAVARKVEFPRAAAISNSFCNAAILIRSIKESGDDEEDDPVVCAVGRGRWNGGAGPARDADRGKPVGRAGAGAAARSAGLPETADGSRHSGAAGKS